MPQDPLDQFRVGAGAASAPVAESADPLDQFREKADVKGGGPVAGMEQLGVLPGVHAPKPKELFPPDVQYRGPLGMIPEPAHFWDDPNGMIRGGWDQLQQGVAAMTRPGADAKMGGASQAIRGASSMALPVVAPVAVMNPLKTTAGVTGGWATGKAARYGAEVLGAGPGAQDLAEDIGGYIGGGAAVKGLKGASPRVQATTKAAVKAAATSPTVNEGGVLVNRHLTTLDRLSMGARAGINQWLKLSPVEQPVGGHFPTGYEPAPPPVTVQPPGGHFPQGYTPLFPQAGAGPVQPPGVIGPVAGGNTGSVPGGLAGGLAGEVGDMVVPGRYSTRNNPSAAWNVDKRIAAHLKEQGFKPENITAEAINAAKTKLGHMRATPQLEHVRQVMLGK